MISLSIGSLNNPTFIYLLLLVFLLNYTCLKIQEVYCELNRVSPLMQNQKEGKEKKRRKEKNEPANHQENREKKQATRRKEKMWKESKTREKRKCKRIHSESKQQNW